jgi:hypothetical protein
MMAKRRDLGGIFHRLCEKIFREALTRAGFIEYHSTLYGDAARGCHHRGDGPGTRKASIRLTANVSESSSMRGSRRNQMERIGSTSLGEGGKHHGSEEEGREEAGKEGREEDLEEEVRHFSSSV